MADPLGPHEASHSEGHDGYTRLLALAEAEPIAAVERWIDLHGPDLRSGLGLLLTHARGLERLLDAAGGNVPAGDRDSFQVLSAHAQGLVETARSARGLDRGAVPEGEAAQYRPSREILAGQLVEAVDLNRQAALWNRAGGLQWAVGALLALRDDSAPPHLAFLPLRLYPGGRYVEQAAAALREAEEAGLKVTSTLRELIEQDLAQPGHLTSLDRQIGVGLWRLYSGIGSSSKVEHIGRAYLARLDGEEDEFVRSVAPVIADTIARASITTGSKAAFFRTWLKRRHAWTDDVAIYHLEAQLLEIAEVRVLEGIGDRMFAETWSAWFEERGPAVLSILDDRDWGRRIAAAIRDALGREVDPEDLCLVGDNAGNEAGSTMEMGEAGSLEDYKILEGV